MENFIGEIRLFPYSRIPKGWKPCNGQILPIVQYQALYSLLGTHYGGNGTSDFALPNLNGRVIMGQGSRQSGQSVFQYDMGNKGGVEKVTLTTAQMPGHLHLVSVNESYDLPIPDTNFLGNPNVPTDSSQKVKNKANANLYNSGGSLTSLASDTVTSVGGSQSHENRMPFLAMVYCIAMEGLYPPRS